MELRPKWLGEDALHQCGVCAEIDEQPPLDDAFDDWNAHGKSRKNLHQGASVWWAVVTM
jgi:hypothetical protein